MVTIVMPAHNERALIERTVDEWCAVARRIPGARVLVVDDASTDGTGQILERLAAERPGLLEVLRNPRNLGHGGSALAGLARVSTPFAFQTDSDGEFPAEEFWPFWERRDACDFVFGFRAHRADGPFRLVVTRTLRLLIRTLFGRRVRDVNCAFRLMRRDAMHDALARVPRDAFIPLALLGIEARSGRWRVEERPARWVGRAAGAPSLRGARVWLRALALSFRDLVRLRARSAG